MAIVALCGFVVRRATRGDPHLRTRDRELGPALLRRDPHRADPRRRRADHRRDLGQGVVGPLVGVGRADAGLLPDRLPAFATYQPLRFSIEDPERQARYASRLRDHGRRVRAAELPRRAPAPRPTRTRACSAAPTGGLPGQMACTFLVALLAMALLFATAVAYEMASKQTSMQLRALRRRLLGSERSRRSGAAPRRRSAARRAARGSSALAAQSRGGRLMSADHCSPSRPHCRSTRPASTSPAPIVVFVALIVIYVAIMAAKLQRMSGAGRAERAALDARANADGSRDRAPRGHVAMSELLAARRLAQDRAARGARAARAHARQGRRLPARGAGRREASQEAVAISTCNRTEIYLVAGDPVEAETAVLGDARAQGGDPPDRAGRPRSTRCATATPRATCTA